MKSYLVTNTTSSAHFHKISTREGVV